MPVPLNVPRFIEISNEKKAKNYIAIEDVLQHFASDLFPDFTINASGVFRITRDSGITVDERAETLSSILKACSSKDDAAVLFD